MWLAGTTQLVTNLHDKDTAEFLGNAIFTFHWRQIWPAILQFLRRNEVNLIGQMVNGLRELVPDFMFHVLDNLKDFFNRGL